MKYVSHSKNYERTAITDSTTNYKLQTTNSKGYVGVEIIGVDNGSLAQKVGIKAGDVLCAINNRVIRDIFDYRFAVDDSNLLVRLNHRTIEMYNPNERDIGLIFKGALFDGAKSCHNNCVFCFMAQNPKNMRPSLYFKDDDYRLSLLHGNYCTLTNMTTEDVEKIISLRISPINISVHTTQPQTRKQLLRSENAGKSLEYISLFHRHGITMNGQIVLCPGINDGAQLLHTIRDLSPLMDSISIVPVGLTKFRQNLTPLQSVTPAYAANLIAQISKLQNENLELYGSRIVYMADEFYVLADIPLPSCEAYEEFAQLENGVGMMSNLRDEFVDALSLPLETDQPVTIVTGNAAARFMRELMERAEKLYSGLQINVIEVENNFFGNSVTVAGLLTGGDIIAALNSNKHHNKILIPQCTLNDMNVFLDDISLIEAQKQIGAQLIPCPNDGYALWEEIRRNTKWHDR